MKPRVVITLAIILAFYAYMIRGLRRVCYKEDTNDIINTARAVMMYRYMQYLKAHKVKTKTKKETISDIEYITNKEIK